MLAQTIFYTYTKPLSKTFSKCYINTLEDWYKSYHKVNCRTKAFFKIIFQTHKSTRYLKNWAKHLRTIYLYSKGLFFSSYPLDNAILLLVSRYPYHWMFEGRLKGRTVVKTTYKDALAILFKGLDHLPKGNCRVIERLWSFDLRVFC